MTIVGFDLEGTLAPELWIEIANHFDVPELRKTTRDVADEDGLMKLRLRLLEENDISYSQIYEHIKTVKPFDGARDLLDSLFPEYQPVIITSCYYQFIPPLLEQLGRPFAFANYLTITDDKITGYKWRAKNHKQKAVQHFKDQNFKVIAVGDSYNDIGMFEVADTGFFFNAPEDLQKKYPQYESTDDYQVLRARIEAA